MTSSATVSRLRFRGVIHRGRASARGSAPAGAAERRHDSCESIRLTILRWHSGEQVFDRQPQHLGCALEVRSRPRVIHHRSRPIRDLATQRRDRFIAADVGERRTSSRFDGAVFAVRWGRLRGRRYTRCTRRPRRSRLTLTSTPTLTLTPLRLSVRLSARITTTARFIATHRAVIDRRQRPHRLSLCAALSRRHRTTTRYLSPPPFARCLLYTSRRG